MIECSSPQGEALDWLQKQTNIRTNHARMLSGPVQGRFLKMIVEMCGARRVLELGSFTGYSGICLASGLPEDGHLDTLEINDELEDLILEGFSRAGLRERITGKHNALECNFFLCYTLYSTLFLPFCVLQGGTMI